MSHPNAALRSRKTAEKKKSEVDDATPTLPPNAAPPTFTTKNIIVSGLLSLVISAWVFWPPSPESDLDSDGFPTIRLDEGTFIGVSAGTVETFLGIPFAKAPIGDLRFQAPQPLESYVGDYSASNHGFSCPQMIPDVPIPEGLSMAAVGYTKVIRASLPDSEDCLTLDVVKPADSTPDSKLPVLVYFFGGGFEFGGIAKHNGIPIVMRSVEMGKPIIYVAMNYRLNAFGFLGGKEVKAAGAGNLGLRDQRAALEWVKKYITAFGGDPTKVTIWGQSAGAFSIGDQMVVNGGDQKGLFRGAIMQSGSPPILDQITDPRRQIHYDALVKENGCTGADDTLGCLRRVPYEELKAAVQKSPGLFEYSSLALTWPTTVDGDFITHNPFELVHEGLVSDVPVLIGNVDDEGTLFTLSLSNITTDQQVRDYMVHYFLPQATEEEVDKMMGLYPQDPTLGSPFDMGMYGADFTQQHKRLAAILGDIAFQSLRRFFLNERSGKQNIWSFLSKRWKGIEHLGAAHSSDLVDVFSAGVTADYFIQFTNTLDPNGASNRTIEWPQYSTADPKLLTFMIEEPEVVSDDTFRVEQNDFWIELGLKYQL